LDGDWNRFREDRTVVLKYFPQICTGLEDGVRLLDEAAQTTPPEKKALAEEDARTARAALFSFRSGLNIERFWDALTAARQAATPETQARVRQSVEEIVAQERENTARMLDLVRQDNRLFYCACTKYVHPLYIYGGFLESGYFSPEMTIEEKLQKKLDTMAEEDFPAELAKLFPVSKPAESAP
jgi:hypothetical protein